MMHLAALGSSSSLSSSRQPIFSHVLVPCVAAFSTVSLLRNPHRNSLNFFCCPSSLNHRRPFSSLSTHRVSLDDGFRTQGISQFEEEEEDDEEEDEDARLSRTHADWKAARVYHENGVIYQGKVEASNAGGLLVRFFSLLGFLPFPLLSPSHVCKEPDKSIQEVARGLIGSFISVKVVSAEEEEKRLIFSEKEATWSKFSKFIKVGDVYQARVGSIEDYGAFVHLRFPDGCYHLTGLLHISEVSWDLVHDVRRVLNVGDEVKVKVVSLDRENLKMSLSMKQLVEDPLLETLEKVIPQDGSAGSSLDGNTDYVIEPLPGLETIITELLNEDGISDIKITRQGFEKRVVSQDLQLWLSNAPSSGEQFTLLARAGRQVQEIQLTTELDQDGIKSALQRVLERIPCQRLAMQEFANHGCQLFHGLNL